MIIYSGSTRFEAPSFSWITLPFKWGEILRFGLDRDAPLESQTYAHFRGHLGQKWYPFFRIFSQNKGKFSQNFWVFAWWTPKSFGNLEQTEPIYRDIFCRKWDIFGKLVWKSDPLEQHIPVCLTYEYPLHHFRSLAPHHWASYTYMFCHWHSEIGEARWGKLYIKIETKWIQK